MQQHVRTAAAPLPPPVVAPFTHRRQDTHARPHRPAVRQRSGAARRRRSARLGHHKQFRRAENHGASCTVPQLPYWTTAPPPCATSRERHARAPLQRYGGQGAPGDAAARLPRKTCMRHVPHMHPHAHSATTIRTVLLVSPHAEPGPCRMRTRACVQQAKCGKARLHSRMRYCSAQGSGHTAAPPRPGSGCGRH